MNVNVQGATQAGQVAYMGDRIGGWNIRTCLVIS